MSGVDFSDPQYHALERRVRRKLDLYVLLPITLLFCASFVEKPNIAYASIAGLIQDLHLEGTQFNNAIAVYFATYVLAVMPTTTLVKKLKPNRVLGFLAGGWGIGITLTGLLVKNYPGLIASRVVLGSLDGGLFPATTFYLSLVYKRYELQSRIGLFYAGGALAGLFGGLLAGAIVSMDGVGKLAGWRWLLILEGIFLIIVAIIVFSVLPTDTATAWFLTEEEREYATWRLGQDVVIRRTSETLDESVEKGDSKDANSIIDVDDGGEEFEWREIRRGVFDIQTWLTGIAFFLIFANVYAAAYFMPSIIVGLGWSGIQAELHTVPAFALSVVLIITVALVGDRLRLRGPFILAVVPISIMGYIILLTAKSNTTRYVGLCFATAGTGSSIAPLLAILANNSRGHYKRASALAVQSTITNISGVVGTYIYTLDQQPRYIRGHCICLSFLVLAWILVAANVSYCIWENKARKEGRRNGNIEKYQALRDAGKTRAPIGDRHPDFIFVL